MELICLFPHHLCWFLPDTFGSRFSQLLMKCHQEAVYYWYGFFYYSWKPRKWEWYVCPPQRLKKTRFDLMASEVLNLQSIVLCKLVCISHSLDLCWFTWLSFSLEGSRFSVLLMRHCEIAGTHCILLIWGCNFCAGDVNNISVGSGTNIQDNSLVHVAKTNLSGKVLPTTIGDNVTVGKLLKLNHQLLRICFMLCSVAWFLLKICV